MTRSKAYHNTTLEVPSKYRRDAMLLNNDDETFSTSLLVLIPPPFVALITSAANCGSDVAFLVNISNKSEQEVNNFSSTTREALPTLFASFFRSDPRFRPVPLKLLINDFI